MFYKSENNPMFGRKHSDYSKNLISQKASKKVYIHLSTGEILQFDSMASAGEYFGVSGRAIANWINRKIPKSRKEILKVVLEDKKKK